MAVGTTLYRWILMYVIMRRPPLESGTGVWSFFFVLGLGESGLEGCERWMRECMRWFGILWIL